MRNLQNYKLTLRRQTVKSYSGCNATDNYGSGQQIATTSMSSPDMERCLKHILIASSRTLLPTLNWPSNSVRNDGDIRHKFGHGNLHLPCRVGKCNRRIRSVIGRDKRHAPGSLGNGKADTYSILLLKSV